MRPKILAETTVDLFQDCVNTRNFTRDELFRPSFERLGENSMVRIGTGRSRDIPGDFPAEIVFIYKDSHKFRDRKSGMRIVDVDCRHLRKQRQRTIPTLVIGNNALQGRRNKEILLLEAKRFSFIVIIGRIQHLRNKLRLRIFAHDFRIISLREKLHVKLLHGTRTPETKRTDSIGILSRYHHIICNSLHFARIPIDGLHAVVCPLFLK